MTDKKEEENQENCQSHFAPTDSKGVMQQRRLVAGF